MERILTLNSGSSSLKFAVFESLEETKMLVSGNMSGVGSEDSRLTIKDGDKKKLLDEPRTKMDHAAAFDSIMSWLESRFNRNEIKAVGHRIVHGGRRFLQHSLIDKSMIEELKSLIPFAPSHLPPALATLDHAMEKFDHLSHIACFDTVFHRTMPELARTFALPHKLYEEGIERFGFHGLSYEFICMELKKRFGEEAENSRVVIAHLGNGCSLAAVRKLMSVDTTMGFSPAGGLVMSTRSGDIDPGLVTYLLEELKYSPSEFTKCVNHESGLLGLSGMTSNMKTLLDSSESKAARAVDLFCYQARKHIAAMAAALNGLDMLVFTGGIGENSAEIRRRICSELGFLGITIDEKKNSANEHDISSGGTTKTLVIQTNEELMIARHTADIVADKLAGMEKASSV